MVVPGTLSAHWPNHSLRSSTVYTLESRSDGDYALASRWYLSYRNPIVGRDRANHFMILRKRRAPVGVGNIQLCNG